jgi:hypothetical protein
MFEKNRDFNNLQLTYHRSHNQTYWVGHRAYPDAFSFGFLPCNRQLNRDYRNSNHHHRDNNI